MLTPDDLKAIGDLLDKKLGGYPTKKELDEKLENQKIGIIALMDEKLEKQTKAILEGVADYIREALVPILDNHVKRLEHLEQHTSHPPGMPNI